VQGLRERGERGEEGEGGGVQAKIFYVLKTNNNVDNPFKSPAVISFCPGILGIERGLKRVGVHPRVVAYVEIEAYICANLVAGMEAGILDPTPIWTDAKTFDARPFRGRIHGIIGGYPCPGESLAGLREGHLYKGFIWPYIRRAFATTGPLWGFFENVDDHLTGTFSIVQRSLQNMGYRVEAGVYSAEEVGATNERQRLFILALANSYNAQWGPWITEILSDAGQSNVQWRKKGADSFTSCSEAVGDTIGKAHRRIGEQLSTTTGSIQQPEEKGISDISRGRIGYTSFPMGQGYEQWEWEEPREVKPGVGCTVNGYSFREDLLRALGNSVVEQTAELAFIDLIRKHLKSL
jgi:DNA (cytosine-5)-methyltransferase 1